MELGYKTCVAADNDVGRQGFLREQHPDLEIIAGEVSDLARASVYNHRDGKARVLLPSSEFWDVGLVCKSRSGLNVNCASNIDCVQNGTDTTGIAYKHARAAALTHFPKAMAWECVPNLGKRSASDKQSDEEFMCSDFRNKKYWAHSQCVDGADYGAFAKRIRLWWVFLYGMRESHHAAASSWFVSVMNSFKIAEYQFDMSEFLIHDIDERRAAANEMNFPLLEDLPQRVSMRGGQATCDWKHDHYTICRFNNMTWPISDFDSSPSALYTTPLLARELEVVYILDMLWPPVHDLEFADVNPASSRIWEKHLDHDGKVRTDSHAGDGPWKHQSPTQVGSGRLVCRYRLTGAQLTTRAPKKFGVRLLEPFEQMRCIGWSDSMWRHARDSWSTYDKLELIPEMAGNAFCIFHYLPVCCALFSTWGRFMPSSVNGDDANDAEGV